MLKNIQINIIKSDSYYYLYCPQFGIVAKNADPQTAYSEVEEQVEKAAALFEEAGIKIPEPERGTRGEAAVTTLLKANIFGFAIKLIFVLLILAIFMLAANRVFPVRGLSDVADYLSLVPEKRQQELIGDAKRIGKLSKPVLKGLGLGCACQESK